MATIAFSDIKDAILDKVKAECDKIREELRPEYVAAKAAHEAAPEDVELRSRYLKLQFGLIHLSDAANSCQLAVERLEIAFA